MTRINLCGVDLEGYIFDMEAFHGYRSPGMLLGGLMLDRALRQLGPVQYLNVVSETVVCLPDAIQLLTPCTIGNGFLQLLDWGKFALTVYDRLTLEGVRAGLVHDRIHRFEMVQQWFDRSSREREKPVFEEMLPEMIRAGKQLVTTRSVKLHRALKETGWVKTGPCPSCSESYALRLGKLCPACAGKGYLL